MTNPTDTANITTQFIGGEWQATISDDCNVYYGKTKAEAILKLQNRPVVPQMCIVCGDFLDPESESYQSQDPAEMCTDCYQEAFKDFVLNKEQIGL